jgi:hypothetical protein
MKHEDDALILSTDVFLLIGRFRRWPFRVDISIQLETRYCTWTTAYSYRNLSSCTADICCWMSDDRDICQRVWFPLYHRPPVHTTRKRWHIGQSPLPGIKVTRENTRKLWFTVLYTVYIDLMVATLCSVLPWNCRFCCWWGGRLSVPAQDISSWKYWPFPCGHRPPSGWHLNAGDNPTIAPNYKPIYGKTM